MTVRTAFNLIILACASGCASLDSLKPGEEISVTQARSNEPGLLIRITNERISEYAGRTAVGGAGAGALSGLACGPLAPLCVPGFAMVGYATGAGVGAVAGMVAGLPTETREALRSKLEHFAHSRDPGAQVTAAIQEKAGERWKVVEGTARKSITIRVRQISLHTRGAEDVAMSISVLVLLTSLDERGQRDSQERWFQTATPKSTAAAWHDDDFVRKSFDYLYERLSRSVISWRGLSNIRSWCWKSSRISCRA